jgi:hypothetical protein
MQQGSAQLRNAVRLAHGRFPVCPHSAMLSTALSDLVCARSCHRAPRPSTSPRPPGPRRRAMHRRSRSRSLHANRRRAPTRRRRYRCRQRRQEKCMPLHSRRPARSNCTCRYDRTLPAGVRRSMRVALHGRPTPMVAVCRT